MQRERKVSGSGFAQALVFGFMANPAATRQEVNQSAAVVGMSLSTPGLDKRFNGRAAYFLAELLQAALAQLVQGEPNRQGLLARFNGIEIGDCSQVALPDELAGVFAGSNHGTAGAKVAVRYDWQRGRLGLWLHDGRLHDGRTGISSSALPAGSLRLNDLGFFNLKTFADDLSAGVDFFTRYKVGTQVFDAGGKRLNLVNHLRRHAAQGLDCPVQVGAAKLGCRLLALPVPADITRQRHQRLRAVAKHKQQPVSPTALALAGWTIYLTSLPVERLALHEAPILGDTRWQVECLFKVWKSDGLLDEWRSHDPERILCEFYAKLLSLLVQHWLMLVSGWRRLERSYHRAVQVMHKYAFHLAVCLPDRKRLTEALVHLARTVFQTCGMSKRKTHPLTFQAWLNTGDG